MRAINYFLDMMVQQLKWSTKFVLKFEKNFLNFLSKFL